MSSSSSSLLLASASVSMHPDGSQLPGWQVLQNLTNGLGGWALMAALAGIVVGAVMWAFGHYSQNYQHAYNGRKGVLVSAVAAILIGGAGPIVTHLVGTGGGIR